MPKYRKTMPAELPQPEVIDTAALAAALAAGSVGLVCVLGPTASGKTRYAVALAHELQEALSEPGSTAPMPEIISADSRQVYRGMDIGTGKDLAEYGDVPFHLIDIAGPGTQYNVHRFCEDFRQAYKDIRSRGAVPILCGGTGMYISAVTGGYDFESRKPLSAPNEAGNLYEKTFFIGTLVSREERNAKIDARLKARLEEGLVEEVRSLLDGTNPGCKGKAVPPEVLISYGLEYKFVTLYLQGELSGEELFSGLSTAIHQFAKRQMTWFRGMERSGIRIHWVIV